MNLVTAKMVDVDVPGKSPLSLLMSVYNYELSDGFAILMHQRPEAFEPNVTRRSSEFNYLASITDLDTLKQVSLRAIAEWFAFGYCANGEKEHFLFIRDCFLFMFKHDLEENRKLWPFTARQISWMLDDWCV